MEHTSFKEQIDDNLEDCSSCAYLYKMNLMAINLIINLPEKAAEILEVNFKEKKMEDDAESRTDINKLKDKAAGEIDSELIIKIMKFFPDGTDLVKFKEMLEAFKDDSGMLIMDEQVSFTKFVDFLFGFGKICGYSSIPIEDFNTLLGQETNSPQFGTASSKLYRFIFYQQKPSKVSFYELSLLSSLQRLYFKENEYVEDSVFKIATTFILGVGLSFSAKRQYLLSDTFIKSFVKRFKSQINAFNGLISDLEVSQKLIPQIVFIMVIFSAELTDSVFKREYGDAELFYCAVRAVCDSPGFSNRLERFITTKLFWNITLDPLASLNHLYSTIFRYEYGRIIGEIKPVSGLAALQTHLSGSEHFSQLKIRIVKNIPKSSQTRSVRAFSPLSRKIGEASTDRQKDSFDSKRKLAFD